MPTTSKYIISKDGELLVFLTDSLTVDIFDANLSKISHIALQAEINVTIQDFAFSEKNTLFIVDNLTNIFTFTQNNCRNTFVINQNSYCVCR